MKFFQVPELRRKFGRGIFPSAKGPYRGGETELSPKVHIDMGVPNPIYGHISPYSFIFLHTDSPQYRKGRRVSKGGRSPKTYIGGGGDTGISVRGSKSFLGEESSKLARNCLKSQNLYEGGELGISQVSELT